MSGYCKQSGTLETVDWTMDYVGIWTYADYMYCVLLSKVPTLAHLFKHCYCDTLVIMIEQICTHRGVARELPLTSDTHFCFISTSPKITAIHSPVHGLVQIQSSAFEIDSLPTYVTYNSM